MKRIIIALAVLVAAFAAFYFLKRNMDQTGQTGSRDFAISNPKEIDKVFFSKKNGLFLTFTKAENGTWKVYNGKVTYPVDTAYFNSMLFGVMPKIEIQSPVNDASKDGVIRDMAISATKAQFYKGDKLVKTIFVGDKTYNDLGTYMHLPGAERPCITRIAGRDGYLSLYFVVNIDDWRSPAILDVPASDIRELQVQWNEKPENSFTIRKDGDEVGVFNHKGQEVEANRNRVLAYLDMFTNVTREAGEKAGVNNTKRRDTILASVPFFYIAITKTNGKKEKLNLYRIPVSTETYSPETREGILKVYEAETYWGALEGTTEIWMLQDLVLKNRMKTLTDITGR